MWQRQDLKVGRQGFAMKLMKLKLHGPFLAYTTSRALKGVHVVICFW